MSGNAAVADGDDIAQLLAQLRAGGVSLAIKGDELSVRAEQGTLAPALIAQLRENKKTLLDMLKSGAYVGPDVADGEPVKVPPNLIPADCTAITPAMLTLVRLSAEEVARVVATVPGGAANVQDIYPLAPLQEGMLFHHLMAQGGDIYLETMLFDFSSRARMEAFVEALQAVVDRHDVLRTAVLWEGLPEPLQVVWRRAPLVLEELRLDGDVGEQLQQRFDARRHRIDLRQAPVIRLYAAEDTGPGGWKMMMAFHHLAADHTTMEVMLGEVQAHLTGQAALLPPVVAFRNFIAQALLGVPKAEHEAFFRAMLGDVEEPTAPFGIVDVHGDGLRLATTSRRLDRALSARLRRCARGASVSVASLCHLAWALVVARTSGRDDVVFGTVLFGRMQGGDDAARAMGLFMNTLPLRVRIGAGVTVLAGLRETNRQLAMLLRHEHASLALAQRCSAVAAPAPLFTALLNYRHTPGAAQAPVDVPEALAGMAMLSSQEWTNYPVGLDIDDLGEDFVLTAQVQDTLDPERLCDFVQHALEQLAEALERAPGTRLSAIDGLPPRERLQLSEWNETQAAYPEVCVHEEFERHAGEHPEAVALVHEQGELSYGELNAQANRLAHHLVGLGVGPGDRVALCVQRSAQMVVAMLAILKAGGAYVPLDPVYPAERLAFMLRDSAPKVLLGDGSLQGLDRDGLVVIDVNTDAPQWAAQSTSEPMQGPLSTRHLAYVIYTSGSTGVPKGVLVEHRGVCNQIAALQGRYGLQRQDRLLQFASINFDGSIEEIFAALLTGAALVLRTDAWLSDAQVFYGLCEQQGITHINLPTQFWQQLVREEQVRIPTCVHRVVITGEAVGEAALAAWFARAGHRPRLFNAYGPTEVTVNATLHEVGDSRTWRCIGHALSNTQLYVLDAHGQPVPVGVAGELYVGGVGVARGYLDRPGLTAERFVPDAFGSTPGARLYRTGDLVRYSAHGAIEYLGRNDDQVKLRGFRIELGEIEARLCEQPGMGEAVVVVREDTPGQQRLVAYCVSREEPDAQALRSALAQRLPEYMLPSVFVRLDALPLTPNGKLDRRALPAPEAQDIGLAYEAPVGEAETVLAQIWTDVLNVERVSRHDDFFALGGHSLLAVRLASRLRQALGVQLRLSELFARPRLSALAEAIRGNRRGQLPQIGVADRGQPLALSFAQQRLWFLAQLEGQSLGYHMPMSLVLPPRLDRQALRRALERIVARHEVLRTVFVQHDGQPVQQIAPADVGFTLHEHDLSGQPDAKAQARQLVSQEENAPFELERGPLIRGRLITLGDEDHQLLITMHHIVSDDWSQKVFLQELGTLYEAYANGREDPLAPLSIQYADYAAWQRQWLQGEELQRQGGYWKRHLAGAPTLLALPSDRARPAMQAHGGAVLDIELDAQLSAQVKALSRRHGTTLYMTLLAAWAVLLARLSGQQDIVIGTPVANRTRLEIEGLIGFFVNTLALRMDLSGSPSTVQLLQRVKAETLDAQDHQDLPFEQVVELINPPRSLSHSPLFQVMFNWLEGEESAPGDMTQSVAVEYVTAQFDLSLDLAEAGECIVGSLEYATALFDRTTIERHVASFKALLQAMVADEQQAVDRLDILSGAERLQLSAWNETQAAYPEVCVHEAFERHAREHPGAVALVHEQGELSYGELNAQANRLAHHLVGLGVGPGDRVALCVQRSAQMVVAMLAILKAGGAYVPLDPAYPAERLAFMLSDSAPKVLLGDGSLQGLDRGGLVVIDVNTDAPQWAQQSASEPMRGPLSTRHLAYVIYTSGSTGVPKGVLVEHRGVCNQIAALQGRYGLQRQDRLLQFASINFDGSIEEIFAALLTGAALVLRTDAWLSDAQVFYGLCEQQQITHINLPTQFWQQLVREEQVRIPTCVHRVVITGEAVGEAALAAWFARTGHRPRLFNAYGPTEVTVNATLHEVGDSRTWRCIGHALSNTQLYVLDAHGQPVPVGVAGELYVGGVGVARGYLDRPGLTAERFVPDAFGSTPGARLYRTGDLVRYSADGAIEYLGRNDDQVKLRGFRIELGEIEARLCEQPGMGEAVVVVREDTPGQQRLVAYCVSREEPDAQALRSALAQRLPEYMLPSVFVRLDALPLTPNGKLDRRALPAPEAQDIGLAYEAPVGEAETVLAQIWTDVLNVERVSRHDDFFALGGHSLLAVRLASRLRQALGVQLRLSELFARPRLSALAEAVRGNRRSEVTPIGPVVRGPTLPLSFAQQRLWFLAQMESQDLAYHMLMGASLPRQLDRPALRRALDRIVARHEVLRTVFVQHDGQPVQQIAPADVGFTLRGHDLSGQPDAKAQVERLVTQEGSIPFDLARGPLIRGLLIDLPDQEHLLLIAMHHIVSDDWSQRLFLEELDTLYEAYANGREDPLPPLSIQYADYAAWQRQWLQGDELLRQSDYWQRRLAGAPMRLELPLDRPRPALQELAGATLDIELDAALSAGLKALSRRHGTTLYMTLLAGWAVLLSRLSGQQDIVIGTPVANRTRVEIEGLIGFFVNMLALRVDLGGSPSTAALLKRVRSETLDAQDHQDLPFEQVVQLINPQRNPAHSPLFQVTFSWLDAEEQAPPSGDMAPSDTIEYVTAKFDMSLELGEKGDRIGGSLEFSTALFDRATVERHIACFTKLLRTMVADDQQPVEGLDLLPAAERHQVLVDWNATGSPIPDGCTHELVEAQAARTPDAVAVVSGAQRLTYAQLDAQANQLAHRLRALGVVPDSRVALCAQRSWRTVVGMLAVLKAGGAYVPLDPAYPAQRLAYLLDDSAPVVVLLDAAGAQALGTAAKMPALMLDANEPAWADAPRERLADAGLTPSHLAYVIYTSGSTGEPKGVMIEHRSLNNLIGWHCGAFELRAGMHSAATAGVGFDASTWEVWPPLCSGGTLVLAPPELAHDASQLLRWWQSQPLDVSFLVTPLAELAFSEQRLNPSLKHLLIGGDRLRRLPELPAGLTLVNNYGPTEATVVATSGRLDAGQAVVHIGRPIANTRIYVLDARGQPVPVGVAGELYVGGEGVARGYLNRPQLTAERFVEDPFHGGRMYRTGDLARYLPDGNIEFLGRNDAQVKIRGFRIELGEIEARLVQQPGIREAVVLAREDEPGVQRLVAYVLADGDAGIDAAPLRDVRDVLAQQLPEYMVPAAIVALDRYPLTANGKLDRAALPAPGAQAGAAREYEAPTGEVEITLAQLWMGLLGIERVDRRDDFFALGGHSLLAVQLLSRMQREGIELNMTDLFQNSTLEALASRARTADLPDRAIAVRPRGDQPPLFLVHDFHGMDSYFAHLAPHIGADVPVYGLPSVPLGREQPRSMAQLTTRLIGMIRAVQPQGPVRVAGWSFGGLVAHEIGAQLLAQGDEVQFVGILDASLSGEASDERLKKEYSRQELLLLFCKAAAQIALDGEPPEKTRHKLATFEALTRLGDSIAFDELLARCADVEILPHDMPSLDPTQAWHYLVRRIAHEYLLEDYRPSSVDVPIHVFMAQEKDDLSVEEDGPFLGWERYVPEKHIRAVPVPGNHISMMTVHTEALGRAMTAALLQPSN